MESLADLTLWAQSIFFMPGDALIRHLAATAFGRELGITEASLHSAESAWISGALWVLAVCAVYFLCVFVLDAADPTYRQHQRERRERERHARQTRTGRKPQRLFSRAWRKRAEAPIRIEPRFGP